MRRAVARLIQLHASAESGGVSTLAAALQSGRSYGLSSARAAATTPRGSLRRWLHQQLLQGSVGMREVENVFPFMRLQRLWEQKALEAWRRGAAALTVGAKDTSAGQALTRSLVPVAVLMHLFPSRFRALACEAVAVKLPSHAPLKQGPLKLEVDELLSTLLVALHLAWVPKVLEAIRDEMAIWARGMYLAMLFTPALLLAPAAFCLGIGREQWMELIRMTLERAGPAFIKWGQWSSTRPDLFPRDLCASLELLQTKAPQHEGRLSRAAIDGAFQELLGEDHTKRGRPAHQRLFDGFDDKPVASGSIAQVHRARLTQEGADIINARMGTRLRKGMWVAIKVRHPGVSGYMHKDFTLMERAARTASVLPGLRDLRLDESIRQFGGPLKEQLDLSVEAKHLERFKRNFRLWTNVGFPTPMHPLVSKKVLVESFEEGDLISTFVNTPEYEHRGVLAQTGLDLYLQMLLKDNFIHADLHPGNILVREVDVTSLRGIASWVSRLLQLRFQPNVILLDTGMIAELHKTDQRNMVDFFSALTKHDGERIADSILKLSEDTCKNPVAFKERMVAMFQELDPATISTKTAEVMGDMIEVLRQHQVTLKSTVSTVLVTSLVLEGWSNKLNPDLHILDTMREILAQDWSDRISRTVDKIISGGAVAVA